MTKTNSVSRIAHLVLISGTLLAFGASTSPSHAATANCAPADVTVFNDRIHVRCIDKTTDGANAIYFFAVPTTDATRANRFMTMAMSALVSGRRVVINFTSGASGASYGCQVADCRPVDFFGIQ